MTQSFIRGHLLIPSISYLYLEGLKKHESMDIGVLYF